MVPGYSVEKLLGSRRNEATFSQATIFCLGVLVSGILSLAGKLTEPLVIYFALVAAGAGAAICGLVWLRVARAAREDDRALHDPDSFMDYQLPISATATAQASGALPEERTESPGLSPRGGNLLPDRAAEEQGEPEGGSSPEGGDSLSDGAGADDGEPEGGSG